MQGVVMWLLAVAGAARGLSWAMGLRHRMPSCKRVGALSSAALLVCGGCTWWVHTRCVAGWMTVTLGDLTGAHCGCRALLPTYLPASHAARCVRWFVCQQVALCVSMCVVA